MRMKFAANKKIQRMLVPRTADFSVSRSCNANNTSTGGNMNEVKLIVNGFSCDELYNLLATKLSSENIKINLNTESVSFDKFNLEPASIIVSGVTGVLTGLIPALLSYLKSKNEGVIIIKSKNGTELQVPNNTPDEKIDYYLKLAKEIDDNIDLIEIEK